MNVFRYVGGKCDIAEQLVERFPRNIYEYREPMLGGGSVLLCARAHDVAEHYWGNDKFKHLYCFWKMAQIRNSQLHKVIMGIYEDCDKDPQLLHDMFEEARSTKTLTEFEAAVYCFFLNRCTFSGTILSGGFSLSAAQDRFTRSAVDRILKLEDPLRDVRITNYDFAEVIEDESKRAFLFVDPPYLNPTKNKLYGNKGKLGTFDHELLARLLRKTNHQFMLTHRESPEIRALYQDWANIETLDKVYGMTKPGTTEKKVIVKELLITNYYGG